MWYFQQPSSNLGQLKKFIQVLDKIRNIEVNYYGLTASIKFGQMRKALFKIIWKKKYLEQGSPTFLKLRATPCVLINAKGYYFDTQFWNKIFAQFTLNYFIIDIR